MKDERGKKKEARRGRRRGIRSAERRGTNTATGGRQARRMKVQGAQLMHSSYGSCIITSRKGVEFALHGLWKAAGRRVTKDTGCLSGGKG